MPRFFKSSCSSVSGSGSGSGAEAAGVLLADAVELPVSEDGSEGSVPPEQPTSSNPIASRSGSSRLQRLRFLVY